MEVITINTLLQVLINLFAAIILVIIAINENQQFDRHLPQERLFLTMVYTNILLCISDAIAWAVENVTGTIYVIINQIFTSIAFIAIPVFTYTWFLYAIFNIFRDEKLLEKYEKYTVVLVMICTSLVISNSFTHWLFYLDHQNRYQRGFLFMPFISLAFVILPITFIMIIYNRKKMQQGHFIPMIIFVVPTIITSILAIMMYGIAISWVGTTIAIFIIYLFIQSQRLGTDYLTGLYNRRQLNEYLQNRLKGRRSNERFGIAMIDINKFKYINDTWGHKSGDELLINLSRLFKTSFRSREFIARYAGDEFIVIMEVNSKDDIIAAIKRFINSIEQFNSISSTPWNISVSIGYDLYEPSSGTTYDELLNHVDKLMYQSKAYSGIAAVTSDLPRIILPIPSISKE